GGAVRGRVDVLRDRRRLRIATAAGRRRDAGRGAGLGGGVRDGVEGVDGVGVGGVRLDGGVGEARLRSAGGADLGPVAVDVVAGHGGVVCRLVPCDGDGG